MKTKDIEFSIQFAQYEGFKAILQMVFELKYSHLKPINNVMLIGAYISSACINDIQYYITEM
jgi:hypothetical protein